MSVQFGNWNFRCGSGDAPNLAQVRAHLAPYGPDGEDRFHDEETDILFFRLQETEATRREEQPYRIGAHQVLTWDGRLDNRSDLLRELAGMVTASGTDAAFVA